MLEKMFTTKMSADKKKLQSRFSKIRSKSGRFSKLFGGILFGIIIIAIISVSVIIGVNNAKDSEINALFELKQTAFSNKDNIEEIVNLANFSEYGFHSLEIADDVYESTIAVKFMVEDRAMHRAADDISLRKMSAIILALVPEAEAVSCFVFDKYSQDINNPETSFYSNYTPRKDMYTMPGFERFTEEYINNSALTSESFEEYYKTVSAIISSYELSDYLKQEYDFIGKDYEFVPNSGIGAEFSVDNDFLSTDEFTEINNLFSVDLSEYEDLAIKLNKISIRNFKTNEYKKHISLHYTEGDKAVIISQKTIDEGKKADEVKLLIQRLMKKTDGMVIPNAENMSYTQKDISFYNINPNDNTLGAEIKKQENGWYQLPSVVSSFINFNGAVPETVAAYFTPTGTNMERYEKQIGFADPPFPQIPLPIKLTFSKEDTMGHLHFVFNYEDGTTAKSELFNVLVDY